MSQQPPTKKFKGVVSRNQAPEQKKKLKNGDILVHECAENSFVIKSEMGNLIQWKKTEFPYTPDFENEFSKYPEFKTIIERFNKAKTGELVEPCCLRTTGKNYYAKVGSLFYSIESVLITLSNTVCLEWPYSFSNDNIEKDENEDEAEEKDDGNLEEQNRNLKFAIENEKKEHSETIEKVRELQEKLDSANRKIEALHSTSRDISQQLTHSTNEKETLNEEKIRLEEEVKLMEKLIEEQILEYDEISDEQKEVLQKKEEEIQKEKERANIAEVLFKKEENKVKSLREEIQRKNDDLREERERTHNLGNALRTERQKAETVEGELQEERRRFLDLEYQIVVSGRLEAENLKLRRTLDELLNCYQTPVEVAKQRLREIDEKKQSDENNYLRKRQHIAHQERMHQWVEDGRTEQEAEMLKGNEEEQRAGPQQELDRRARQVEPVKDQGMEPEIIVIT